MVYYMLLPTTCHSGSTGNIGLSLTNRVFPVQNMGNPRQSELEEAQSRAFPGSNTDITGRTNTKSVYR
jgi:hypothetical protein